MSDITATLSQLESRLWESANILRGPVDAVDIKTYPWPNGWSDQMRVLAPPA